MVNFRLKWDNGTATKPRTAVVSNLYSIGDEGYGAIYEFIAVDPISFFLNRGDTSGKMYEGKIGGDDGIIAQVIDEYVPPGITKKISETTDQPSQYWAMRQDPKTFIASLIDWSSSLTKNKTHWIVASGEDEDQGIVISIEESYTASLRTPAEGVSTSSGPMVFRYGGNKADGLPDILRWEQIHDNFIVALNTKLATSSISAISGEYLDRITDGKEEKVIVKDENTEKKSNPSFADDQGFLKPSTPRDRGWTYISSIPEFNAGDIGKKYSEYIDGRARQTYMNMLNLLMRIKVTVRGEPRMFDSLDLGRSYVTLRWFDIDADGNGPRFMNGNWLLYGWHHKLYDDWTTDVYLSRLDSTAEAIRSP